MIAIHRMMNQVLMMRIIMITATIRMVIKMVVMARTAITQIIKTTIIMPVTMATIHREIATTVMPVIMAITHQETVAITIQIRMVQMAIKHLQQEVAYCLKQGSR